MNPENPAISIGADGIDAGAVVAQIQAEVARKRAAGAYDEARVARAERNNLLTLKDDASFMEQYLLCLRQIVAVDINDFEIIEKRGRFAPALVRLKKAIWKLLKFYTFRLWSQQNQTNALLLAAVEIMETRHRREIAGLRERIAKLEGSAKCD
ncbi:MAG: hypothetical protein PHW08_14085 [Kiritimatiellae bacterium]|jgi:hypothetical protein|nr:hypothetical protein [Kiritimatiellia bacterium]